MPQLTTTSHLILGMLTVRDWSAYELAEYVDKGLTELWPRARRQLYNAPKTLVTQGLATTTQHATGRRRRTVYSITPDGRRALRDWLATAPAQASLEFEGLVRLLLADEGSREDLRATLRTVREQARQSRAVFEAHVAYIRDTDGGSFPERRHLFALANDFMIGHLTHVADWATRALAEVDTWDDKTKPR